METSGLTGGRIALLPEHVRNQIAAGEVVERPASVVKELLENALDAGATRIQIDLEEGGTRLVRVSDDGLGMGREDAELAFVPHATSKLRSPEDLLHIASLGFRGEALASMGSVARCQITTRRRGDELGWRVVNEGGRFEPAQQAGAPQGTSVEVRDLFFNTPARRRFLKAPGTEFSRCLDVVQRAALAHDGVGFVLTHDGRRAYDVEPGMDFAARIRRTFGSELAAELVPIEAADGRTQLSGFVAPPRFSRRDTSRQMWFLNGRTLRDRILSAVLREGYRGFLVENRQPVVFLRLAMDPALVDVNVHPMKSEVRFREERRLFGFLVNALREAVRRTDMATPGETLLASAARREASSAEPTLPDPGVLLPRRPPTVPERYEVREVPGAPWRAEPARPAATGTPGSAAAPEGSLAAPARDTFQGPFLQIARTYLVRALPDGFEIVDQHALHERITYEALRREARAGAVNVQRLLVPELVELARSEVQLLAEHAPALTRLGIELEPFGATTIAVHGLPARLRRPDAAGLVADLVRILEETGKAPGADEVLEEVLHRAACRSSVMAGDELQEAEIAALLERGAELESDQTCPHSRPTRVRFTLADLEKAFHRR